MLTRLRGAKVYDPSNGVDGEAQDIYIQGNRIAEPPVNVLAVDKTVDVRGCAVMAGGIDIHTHIGGGKVKPKAPTTAKSSSPGE